ncbi:MAG: nickel-dependent hydrogenase large subunit [Dehalococcoidia bacterium]|nr:nickel-dependent hydrogenase large subunit [Dehalococcoidia bacterium]
MSNSIHKTTFTMPIGPVHPAIHEPIRLNLSIDGEEIVDGDVAAGQVHRGIEWIGMNRNNPVQSIYLAERVCGICSACHPFTFVQAVEQVAGIEVPPRAEYIRVIVAEMERIHSHLLWAGVAGHEIGFESLFHLVWRVREEIMNLTEYITGNRNSKAMYMIGGVRRDITPDQGPIIQKSLDYYKGLFDELKKLLLDDPLVKLRTQGVGVLSKEDALRLCAAGPTLRASGVATDVRQDFAYSAYADLGVQAITPDMLTGTNNGDTYDRIIVRLLEVKQSIELIEKAVATMPDGPIMVEPKIAKLLALLKKSEGEAVARTEAPRGECLHYVNMKAGQDTLNAWKIRAPTYANLVAIPTMLKGQQIADVPIAFASIDPCMSCSNRAVMVDRHTGQHSELNGEQLHALSVDKTRRLNPELTRK